MYGDMNLDTLVARERFIEFISQVINCVPLKSNRDALRERVVSYVIGLQAGNPEYYTAEFIEGLERRLHEVEQEPPMVGLESVDLFSPRSRRVSASEAEPSAAVAVSPMILSPRVGEGPSVAGEAVTSASPRSPRVQQQTFQERLAAERSSSQSPQVQQVSDAPTSDHTDGTFQALLAAQALLSGAGGKARPPVT